MVLEFRVVGRQRKTGHDFLFKKPAVVVSKPLRHLHNEFIECGRGERNLAAGAFGRFFKYSALSWLRAASSRIPEAPRQAMYMVAATAHRLLLVQMLDVAFSLRICCSRVARVRTNPSSFRIDCLSNEPARHVPHMAHPGGKNPEARTAEGLRDAEALAFTGDNVRPQAPGTLQDPIGQGSVKAATKRAP